jgi:hypothetical protein
MDAKLLFKHLQPVPARGIRRPVGSSGSEKANIVVELLPWNDASAQTDDVHDAIVHA